MFALKELVSTEESYVQDLSLIVHGWVGGVMGGNVMENNLDSITATSPKSEIPTVIFQCRMIWKAEKSGWCLAMSKLFMNGTESKQFFHLLLVFTKLSLFL